MGVEIYNEMPLADLAKMRQATLLANTASLDELQSLKADLDMVKMLLLQQMTAPGDMPDMPPLPEGGDMPPMP